MNSVHNFRIKYTVYTSRFEKLAKPFYYYVNSVDEAKDMVHLLDDYNGHIHELMDSFSADLEFFDLKSQEWLVWTDEDGQCIWDLVDEDEDEDSYFNRKLKEMLTGLVWKSKIKSLIHCVYLGAIDNIPEYILKNTDSNSIDDIKSGNIDELFYPVIKVQNYHGETEKAEVKRYQNLLLFLKKYLSNIRVYYIGDSEIKVYIIGETIMNCFAGLTTKIVKPQTTRT